MERVVCCCALRDRCHVVCCSPHLEVGQRLQHVLHTPNIGMESHTGLASKHRRHVGGEPFCTAMRD